jgi:hypothetical protein
VTATAPTNANAITRAVITLDVILRPSFGEANIFQNQIFHIRISISGLFIREFYWFWPIIAKISIRYYLQKLILTKSYKKKK